MLNLLSPHHHLKREKKNAEHAKKATQKDIKCKDLKEDASEASTSFLVQLGTLDEEIDIQEDKNNALWCELVKVKIEYTVHQGKLDQKSGDLEKTIEKYNVFVKQHASYKSVK